MPNKKAPLIISVVGSSGSGKTATIEYLTKHLTELGFKVGVAKHIHIEGFTIDTEGKDTWKHAKAGARVVIAASPNELVVIKKTPQETRFKDIIEILRDEEPDMVLLEGFSAATSRRNEIQKIVAAKDASDLKYNLGRVPSPILAITGLVARNPLSFPNAPAPIFDIPREGPLLTSMLRRRLCPKELEHMLKEASRRHGETCVGLAIGVRAAYVALSAFGRNPSTPSTITCGTKHCIAEAFKMVYPKSRVRIDDVRNDQILLRSNNTRLLIQLAAKRKFSVAREVLKVPDRVLFESVSYAQQ